jgi:hypothetical protein
MNIVRELISVAQSLSSVKTAEDVGEKTPNDCKKLLREFFKKNKLPDYRLSSTQGSNVITVFGWPSMQGQGAEAAGWMEVRWSNIEKFAKENGFSVKRRYG